jgi:hypothetical protein
MRRNTIRSVGMAVVALAVSGLLAGVAMAAAKDRAPLQFVSDGSPAGGKSTLTRADDSVSARVNAHNLMPGAAYTYWYVIFNMPENCSDGVCGEDDIFLPDGAPNTAQIDTVKISALGGNGAIANGGGHAVLTGTVFEGSPSGLDVLIGPGGLIPGYLLMDSEGAEIHIVVRNHGPALDGGDLFDQLNTFTGNCIGLDPDGTFECVDEQFAMHFP